MSYEPIGDVSVEEVIAQRDALSDDVKFVAWVCRIKNKGVKFTPDAAVLALDVVANLFSGHLDDFEQVTTLYKSTRE